MGVVVLIVLAAVWAAVLLPPVVRSRSQHRPSGSISEFRRQLHVLGRTCPISTFSTGGGVPPTPLSGALGDARIVPIRQGIQVSPAGPLRLSRSRAAVKRRRDIFVGLLVAMAGSLVLGALPPLRALWVVHVVVDIAFAAYVGTLIYLRNATAEREMKLRFLPGGAGPEPALLLRRSAN